MNFLCLLFSRRARPGLVAGTVGARVAFVLFLFLGGIAKPVVCADNDAPASLAEFLDRGLALNGMESPQVWQSYRDRLVESGWDETRSDLALAIIFAHVGRFVAMREVLEAAEERSPEDVRVRRLLSWSRMSSHRLAEGLEDVYALVVSAMHDDAKFVDAGISKHGLFEYAGSACGFAAAVAEEAQPHKTGDIQALRSRILASLPKDEADLFLRAEGRVRRDAGRGLSATKSKQHEEREKQVGEKEATKAELEQRQAALRAEAAQRAEQMQRIEHEARQRLAQIAQQAAPFYAQIESLAAQLAELRGRRAAANKDDQKGFDPLIALVQGQIDGVSAQVRPFEVEYSRIEQTALNQLQVLGGRMHNLGQLHRGNQARLRQNEGKNETGKTSAIAAEIKTGTRFASFVPLDFLKERTSLLRGGQTGRSAFE